VSSACQCFLSTTLGTSSQSISKSSSPPASTASSTVSSAASSTQSSGTCPTQVSTLTLTVTSSISLPASTASQTITDDVTLPPITSYITLPASIIYITPAAATITDDITLPPITSYITLPASIVYVTPAASTITDDVTFPVSTVTLPASTIYITPAASTIIEDVTLPALTSTVIEEVTSTLSLPGAAITDLITLPPSTTTQTSTLIEIDISSVTIISTVTTTERITLIPPTARPTPALVNPGFETGNLAGWTMQGDPTRDGVTCQLQCFDCSYPPTDTAGCGFTWNIFSPGTVQLSQTIQMCLAGTWQLSYNYWTQGAAQMQAFVNGVPIGAPNLRTDVCGPRGQICPGQWATGTNTISLGPATTGFEQLAEVTIPFLWTQTSTGTFPEGALDVVTWNQIG